ncbi:histidine phosphatase family protein [Turneriella parva]|uniref:Phosphoglycerate mutase n=1 Tax=Turneriella parva (strain ATCC BAA-1111 / DSM 21527 / NCTC 11395 / H) TaxID=869212 RepID=I4B4X7_TURPD|nr:histidine phosphatase family protein [Turneriella parva]AFM12334.1 Phosphoglycerate mutase [Turneriella parva DSM 21527]
MVELTLIRHGQADSAGDNYDQLTPTGHEQARRVGEWLAADGYRFDRLFHGGLNRQRQTLEAICAELAKSGAVMPAMEIHSSYAEFDLKVWGIIAAKMRHGHPEFAELFKQWNHARQMDAANKGDIFKQLTGHILKAWVAAGENFNEAESFPAFQKRVLAALEIHSDYIAPKNDDLEAAREFHSCKFLAVTSGGPISLLVGQVLGLDLARTLGLMRRIANTSIHHLIYEKGDWQVAGFNIVPHLSLSERTLV